MIRFKSKKRPNSRRSRGKPRQHRIQQLEQRLLLASDWQNACNQYDVTDNGVVSPLDALRVINKLAREQGAFTPAAVTPQNYPPDFYDVSGNGEVSPIDALRVINYIGRTGGGGDEVDSATQVEEVGSSFVITQRCSVILFEGDQFETKYEKRFTVPDDPSAIQFSYDVRFDTTDPDFINDALEVALVDDSGRTLVHTIARSNDAAFNWTEGESTSQGINTLRDGNLVKIDLSHVQAGTEATLVARLVNNDADTTTTVNIQNFEIVTGSLGTPIGSSFAPTTTTRDAEIDFGRLSDVTDSLNLEYGQTSFHEGVSELFTHVSISNVGAYEVDGPLLLVINNISDPAVRVLKFDGTTPDGSPYFDFSSLLNENTLRPLETTNARELAFWVPDESQFRYEASILGHFNESPNFVSQPITEAIVGSVYEYGAVATDPEGDELTYSLKIAPSGMTIDAATGLIAWQTSEAVVGTHAVIVEADDGRGGLTDQRYSVNVVEQPPNRPPNIISDPVVLANVNHLYEYDVEATDPDKDSLTYELLSAPDGMQIDDATGLVSWLPDSSQILAGESGKHSVVVAVSDGRGGTATQSYLVQVNPMQGNRPPVIVSQPVTATVANESIIASSNWDDGTTQGWQFEDDVSGAYTVSTGGGNPSGYVSFADEADVGVSGVFAPTEYLGDLSNLGSAARFEWDAKVERAGEFGEGVTLWISGPGGVAHVDNDYRMSQVTSDVWQSYNLPLLEPYWTVTEGSWDQIIASVTRVRVSLDLVRDAESGPDGAIDNFRLVGNTSRYSYDVDAIDPDSHGLIYELLRKPEGMRIDQASGMIQWGASLIDVGEHEVVVRVRDVEGGSDEQRFQLSVASPPKGEIHGVKFEELNGNGLRDYGGEFLVNTTVAGNQLFHDVDVDGRDIAIVVWQSRTEFGWDIMGRRFGPSGKPLGDEFLVNTTVSGNQTEPTVSALSTGEFVVAWDSDQNGNLDFYARRFAADGSPLGDEFRGNTLTDGTQANGSVRTQPDGGFFLAWGHGSGNIDAYARRFDAAGSPLGPEFLLSQTTAGYQQAPELLPLSDDKVLAVWYGSEDGDNRSVSARLFDASGAPLGDQFVVNQTTRGDQRGGYKSVGVDLQGNAIISWASGGQTYARIYASDGNAITDEFRVNTATGAFAPRAAAHPDGGFVVAWNRSSSGTGTDVFARRVAVDGSLVGNEILVNETTIETQFLYGLGAGPNGSFMVAWYGNGPDDTEGVFARRYDAAGPLPDEPTLEDWTIYLDQNQNGFRDPEERIAVTDDGGKYSFDGLSPGTYYVREEQQAGWYSASPDTGFQIVELGMDEVAECIDFGNRASLGIIQGTKFHDLDGDGLASPFGDLLVSSFNNDQVLRFDTETGNFGGVLVDQGVGGLDGPEDLVVGPDGKLYVVDHENHQVLRYDVVSGAFIDVFASGGGLSGPQGLAFGPDGHLYVAGGASHNVVRYDGTTGAFLDEFVTAQDNGLIEADGIAFGPDGRLYVASTASGSSNGAIYRFDGQTGDFIDIFATGGNPSGIEFGPNGDLYAGWNSSQVVRIDANTGAIVEVIAEDETHFPLDVTFDRGGNLFISGFGSGEIIQWDPDTGQRLATYESDELAGPTYLYFIADEPTLSGWTIYIDENQNGTRDLQEIYAVTNSEGRYSLTQLPPGTHHIREEEYPGWIQTFPSTLKHVVTISGGDKTLGIDFGNRRGDGEVHGEVFDDLNGNGGRDVGNEFRVNTTIETVASLFGHSSVDSDPLGNSVVVWQSSDFDGSGENVYGRLFDPFGNPRGSEFRLNDTVDGFQAAPSVAMLPDGGFVARWQGKGPGDDDGIFARRFDSAGLPLGIEFLVNSTTDGDQTQGSIAAHADGSFTIIFSSRHLGDLSTFGQRFSPDGTRLGSEFLIFENSQTHTVEYLSDGRFVVTGRRDIVGEPGAVGWLRIFDADGIQRTPDVRINESTMLSSLAGPKVAVSGDDRIFVMFGAASSNGGFFGRFFDSQGVPTSDEFVIDTNANARAAGAAAWLDDDAVVVAMSKTGLDGSQTAAYARRVDARDQSVGELFVLNQTTTGPQSATDVVQTTDGKVLFVWHGNGPDDSNGVFGRRYPVVDEPGNVDWVIYLDDNRDGVRNDNELFATTEVDGSYSLYGVPPGTHWVAQEQRPTWRVISPVGGVHQVDLSESQSLHGIDFANTQGGEIRGCVYASDAEGLSGQVGLGSITQAVQCDGAIFATASSTEEEVQNLSHLAGIALAGWTVYLDQNENGVRDVGEQYTLTDPFGRYRFESLPVGVHHVAQELPFGWEQRLPVAREHTVHLERGEIREDVAFVNRQVGGNRDPQFDSSPLTIAVVGEPYRYDAMASDLDDDALQFDLVVKPEGMAVQPLSRIIAWVPNVEQEGFHDVILRVKDGNGGVAFQSFVVAVAPANTPPSITSIPKGPAIAGHEYQYQLLSQDAEGDPIELRLDEAPAGMTLNPTTNIVSWIPRLDDVGDHPIAIVAEDDRKASTKQSFVLSVIATADNDPPTIRSMPRLEVRVGTTYLYRIDADDPNSDPLQYSLPVAPSGMSLSDDHWVSWIPTVEQLGVHSVQIRVEDSRGGFATQSYQLAVVTGTVNAPPTISTSPPGAATVQRAYTYDARADDPNEDPLVWNLESGPVGMSIDRDRGSLRWTPASDQLGEQPVSIRATDPYGGFSTQNWTIVVRAVNVPPNITSTAQTMAVVDSEYQYAVFAEDVDGDPITFSLSVAPDGMGVDPSGLITWTPDASQLGSNNVQVMVDDGHGGVAEQDFTIIVAEAGNQYPEITSDPTFNTTAEQKYVYQIVATDPDGPEPQYLLLAGPDGVGVDPISGLLEWTPTRDQIGDHQISVGAVDSFGAAGSQTWPIRVHDGNQSPTIDSAAVQGVVAGLSYRYQIVADDPDGDPIRFRLDSGPEGMSVDAFGRVRWSPGIADIGIHRVEVTVADNRDASVTQTFDIAVIADGQTPRVDLLISQNPAQLDSPVTFVVSATDNVGVASIGLTIDGIPVELDPDGRFTFVAGSLGVHDVVASASDAAGNTGLASTTLTVFNPNDTEAPDVWIASPADYTEIARPIDIIGTASDENLAFFKIEVSPVGQDDFREIAHGNTSIVDGVLGEFDPTIFANGTYRLRLTASDGQLESSIENIVDVVGDLKIGNFTLSFTDLSIPVAGIPITVTRTYDSLNAGRRDEFGYGWRMEFRDTNLVTNVTPTGAEQLGYYTAFDNQTQVYVTLPGGRRERFTFNPQPSSGFSGLAFYDPVFDSEPGSTSVLIAPEHPLLLTNDGRYVSPTGISYNPADTQNFGGKYQLVTDDGLVYEIDANTGDLNQITDPVGNTLTYGETSIDSSTGKRITFERDPQGRITAVIDPKGQRVEYEYNARGDLVKVTDREQNETQFVYDEPQRPHFLTEIIDPLGRTGVRSEYDQHGRLVKLIDVDGNPVELVHDPDNFIETVVDALGNRTIFEYDVRGNVVAETDAEGGRTERTYDDRNNMLTETVFDGLNPDGFTTTFSYNGFGDVFTETDPLGNVTQYTYQAYSPSALARARGIRPFRRVASITDPLGNTTINRYNDKGLLTETQDALENVTRFTYDRFGNQTSITDPLLNVTQFDYDSAGNLIEQTDALGNVTIFGYDSLGNQVTETTTLTTPSGTRTLVTKTRYDAESRPVEVTDAEGHVTRTEYDALGNQVATVDALGRRTEFDYDQRGQMIGIRYADNTSTSIEYDKQGRRTRSVDRAGRETNFVYDAVGRLVATLFPDETPDDATDNPRTQTEYDLAGRAIAQIDERGNRTEFEYDAAGRQVLTSDALLNETVTNYDDAGRVVSSKDALGRTTEFEYDDIGRLLTTIFVDGSIKSTEYDALGRVVEQTDQAGRSTGFEYDVLGRLVTVIDALEQRTEYEYDEAGNLTIQRDANGHETRFEYDDLGRRVAHILPLGGRSTTGYDAIGNVIRTTDFNGATLTYEYDINNRLLAKHLSDERSVEYTYTATGLRESVTDDRGTTSYAYDVRDRLISRMDPDGSSISYEYDLAGNRTSVTTTIGTNDPRTTSYGYDVLNRPVTVTDPESEVTTYGYDPVSNLIRTEYPNGTIEQRVYDDLNRLQRIAHSDATDEVFASFDYELDLVGNRVSMTEFDGRRVAYQYDDLYRLTDESIFLPGTTDPARTIGYTYDSVGNRLTRDDSDEGLTEYDYDDNDRLVVETLGDEASRYEYDDNGNTLRKVNDATDAVITEYSWDVENRLVAADTDGDGTNDTEYQYDADGVRISSIVAGEQQRYLIDTNRPYAQVLEEYTTGGIIKVSYVHGLDLISQNRPAETGKSFYHVDGLGSTRALTGVSGLVTDSYIYDAFGRTIGQVGSTGNVYLFAGEQRDLATGLDYLRARYLDSGTGRFFGMDPFQGFQQQPMSLHRFLYANANPVMNIDPSGEVTLTQLSVTTAVLGILAVVTYPRFASTILDRFDSPDLVFEGKSLVYPSGRMAIAGVIQFGDRTWSALSGPWGNGPAPVGKYTVDLNRIVPLQAGQNFDSQGFVDNDTDLGYFIPIEPQFSTNRTGLGFHPDGGDYFGTLGCIGIISGEISFYQQIAALPRNTDLTLEVKSF